MAVESENTLFSINDIIIASHSCLGYCIKGNKYRITAMRIFSGGSMEWTYEPADKTERITENTFHRDSLIHDYMSLVKETKMAKEFDFVKKQTVIMEGYHDDLDLISIDDDFVVGDDENGMISISLTEDYFDAEIIDKLIAQLKILKSQAFPEAK